MKNLYGRRLRAAGAGPCEPTRLNDAYTRAGVDIDAGNEAVQRYKTIAAQWRHPAQIDALGGFGGLFEMPGDPLRALAASTDGVGTKVLIAAELRRYETVGADLVNHCVNDILVVNADPLFFLDYLAVGKLDPKSAAQIVSGVHAACRNNNCALLGGETAEMPDLYAAEDFDLAGTIVGSVQIADLPKPETVQPLDAIIGLPSVGLHTNGYTLARKLIPAAEWSRPFDGGSFADALLAEHPSYHDAVRAIAAAAQIKAMAHITGGGLLENVPRTLPPNAKAIFEQSRWRVPALIEELCKRGNLSDEERYRVFNMGLGFTVVVPLSDAERAKAALPGARIVGWVEERREGEPAVIIHPARA